MAVASGKYIHAVDIQALPSPETQSDFGEVSDAYATVQAAWRCRVKDIGGREAIIAEQVAPEASQIVEMRYYSGLTCKHRLKFGTRYLNIEAVTNPDGKLVEHVVFCKEAAS